MNNIKAYVKKNAVFVILLTVILLITIAIGIYYFLSVKPEHEEPAPQPQITEEIPEKAEIKSFEGSYTSAAQVVLNWSITKNKAEIISVQLYHKDNMIADVSNLNTYTLPQSVYQFPGGANEFKLVVLQGNGEKIEKIASVNINYLMDMKCTTEETDSGVIVKLTYKYEKVQNISVPRITVNAAENSYGFIYKDTEREEDGNYIRATTSYEINTTKAQSSETVKIRWFFDSLNVNYDYPVKLTPKTGKTKTEQPPDEEAGGN